MYTQTTFPVIDLAGTGRSIELHRRQAGLTVRDVQDYFGFEYPQAIYKWQHGECLPTVDNLLALARLLRVSMEDLLVYKDQEVRHFWLLRARKTARWVARARKTVRWTVFTEQRAGRPWVVFTEQRAGRPRIPMERQANPIKGGRYWRAKNSRADTARAIMREPRRFPLVPLTKTPFRLKITLELCPVDY